MPALGVKELMAPVTVYGLRNCSKSHEDNSLFIDLGSGIAQHWNGLKKTHRCPGSRASKPYPVRYVKLNGRRGLE